MYRIPNDAAHEDQCFQYTFQAFFSQDLNLATPKRKSDSVILI